MASNRIQSSNEAASSQKGRFTSLSKSALKSLPPVPGNLHKNRAEEPQPVVHRWQNDPREKLVQRCIRYYDERDEVDRCNELLSKDISSLQEEITRLSHCLAKQDENVREAQESAFALMKSSATKAEDDSVVESKLNATRAQWKAFAKEWAVKLLSDVKEEWFAGEESLVKTAVSPGTDFPNSLWSKNNVGRAPPILLNTELAFFIGREIVTRPFISAFGFGSEQDSSLGGTPNTMDALEKLYDKPRQEITAAKHLWRSMTVGLFDPQEQDSAHHSTTAQEAQMRRDKYYRMLITKFESSKAKFLYRECDEAGLLKRRMQLSNIFRSIGELTSRLWAQKVYISILGLKDLSQTPFTVKSNVFEAHATHKLEEDDTSLDGSPIERVVEPAIVAWENERGESYDVYKVWAKAVV